MSENLCKLVDHTILKADATKEDVKRICEEAIQHGFASVCINPVYVSYVRELLKGSEVKVCTVIGFPLGANTTAVKVAEAKDAINNGAKELDMVINIGAAKTHDYEAVKEDIAAVRAVIDSDHILKVIIETCLLTDEEKIEVCKVCKEVKVDFVKTSTGFSTGGATPQDVELMSKTVGNEIKVKASGGIRCTEDAKKMVEAGADRLGCSAGVKIAKGE